MYTFHSCIDVFEAATALLLHVKDLLASPPTGGGSTNQCLKTVVPHVFRSMNSIPRSIRLMHAERHYFPDWAWPRGSHRQGDSGILQLELELEAFSPSHHRARGPAQVRHEPPALSLEQGRRLVRRRRRKQDGAVQWHGATVSFARHLLP